MNVQYIPLLDYPEIEKAKLQLLENLFRDWHGHFENPASKLGSDLASGMVFDGFYPHYFGQKTKILFIGREALGIAFFNYLDVLHMCYKTTKKVGKQPLNRNKFHARMLHIAYGIVHENLQWEEIPYATVIGDTFATVNGLSFAFMNISKLSNESRIWRADWNLIKSAFCLSTQDRNFIQEEIAILEPDIIITMRLNEMITSFGDLTPIFTSGPTNSYRLNTKGHRSLLIDTWHFSAPRKKAFVDYYQPIWNAIQSCKKFGI